MTISALPRAIELASHRESDDGYRAIVVRFSDKWRVIVCKDHLQWIIQRSEGVRHGQRRWTGVHYCTTRDALLRLCRACGECADPAMLAVLSALPDVIGRAAT